MVRYFDSFYSEQINKMFVMQYCFEQLSMVLSFLKIIYVGMF